MSTKLTIGMATFEDFDGVYFTLQALRMYQELRPDDELIVIDNSPSTPAGAATRDLCHSIGARYIPFAESTGTTQTREQVFKQAKGDAVLCMDCHVLLVPGAIQRLRQWYDQHPDSLDLYQGPMSVSYTHLQYESNSLHLLIAPPVGFANLDLHEETRIAHSKAVSYDKKCHLIAVDSSLSRLGVEVIVTNQWMSLFILSEAESYASKVLIWTITRRTAGESIFPTIIFWTLAEKAEIIQENGVANSILE